MTQNNLESHIQFCNYCRKETETIDGDCPVCHLSKPPLDPLPEGRKIVFFAKTQVHHYMDRREPTRYPHIFEAYVPYTVAQHLYETVQDYLRTGIRDQARMEMSLKLMDRTLGRSTQ